MPENVKGALRQNAGQKHRYRLLIVGLNPGELLCTAVSGPESMVGVAELPDRTRISDGELKAGSFTIRVPSHQVVEIAGMNAWEVLTRTKAPSVYKKDGTLLVMDTGRNIVRAVKLEGLWPEGHKEPDLEMGSEGEMTEIEYTLSYDSATPARA